MSDDPVSELKTAEFKEAFSLFDTDNEGSITPEKLGVVMRSLDPDLNPTDAELAHLINSVDKTGDTKLGFADFLQFMGERSNISTAEEEIKEAFKIFDLQKEGVVTSSGLRTVMGQLGEHLSEQEVDAMINQWSSTKDGTINLEDFTKLMQNVED